MRRFAFIAVLLAARSAGANQCLALYRHVMTPEVPLGCPVVAYQDQRYHTSPPGVWIEHGGAQQQITPAITSATELLDVYIASIDDSCVEHNGYEQHPFDRMTIDVGAVEVGDSVLVESGTVRALIVDAGPCPVAVAPENLSCQDPIQEYWDCQPPDPPPPDPQPDPPPDDSGYFGGGCDAGGGLGIAAAALLVGLRRRRTTSRR